MAKGVKFTPESAKRIARVVREAERMPGDQLPALRGPRTRQPPQPLFAVRVTIDGGAAGSATTNCTWTYTVTFDSGYQLGTLMTPQRRRVPLAPYTTTPAGSWGAGFFDKDGVFVLWDANELLVYVECVI
jgi:hypothetical protein